MVLNILLHYIVHPKAIINKLYCLQMSRKFNTKKLYFSSRMRKLEGIEHISVGEGCTFGKNAIVTAIDNYHVYKYNPHIKIGRKCNFGDWIHISAINDIEIGDGVLTGRFVTINDNSHGYTIKQNLENPPIDRQLTSKGSIIIGNNVWIGDKVSILGGVTIGNGSIIGANSVVTKDIPPSCVAVGIPAKVIKVM